MARSTLVPAGLVALTLALLGYWLTGPVALAPWRMDFKDINLGARARRGAPPPPVKMGHADKISLPVVTHVLFHPSNPLAGHPAGRAEKTFLWLLAFDAAAAALLVLALLRWRRDNPGGQQLAWTLALFAVALACFLVNGQAGLRGNWFVWPSWPRLLTDVGATLAFGLGVIGLNRLFAIYPIPLEDWQVLAAVRLRGKTEAPAGRVSLLGVARFLPKLILGITTAATVVTALPYLLFTISHPFETKADNAPRSWEEKVDLYTFGLGTTADLITLGLLFWFGWLIALAFLARLKAARQVCTEAERRRSDWLLGGGLIVGLMIGLFCLGLVLELVYLAWGDWDWVRRYAGAAAALFFPVGWLVMLGAFAGAVFLSEGFGPRPLLKRTLLIAAAGLLASFILGAIQQAIAMNLVHSNSFLAQRGVNTFVSGAVIAAVFGLFRRRMEGTIEGALERFMPATVIADGKRRLATIVFSDLGGYTALAAADEKNALLAAGYFQKTGKAVANRTGGRVLKTMGDAILWSFDSPAAAMNAAVLLRAEFAAVGAAEGLVRLPINSGIHYGPVVEAPDGDIYGVAVNLAARLQGAAKDGEIIASAAAVEGAGEDFKFTSLGELTLKNVPTPIACFRVDASPGRATAGRAD